MDKNSLTIGATVGNKLLKVPSTAFLDCDAKPRPMY